MNLRLAATLAERTEIDRDAGDVEVVPAVAMHPDLAEAYRRNVGRLTEALDAPEMEARATPGRRSAT